MSKKIDRALYGPSLFEVTLGAVLSVGLGAVVAFLFLVFKPVVVAKELPKEEERVESTVYYIEGKDDSAKDRQWIRKRQMLLDGTTGDMTLSEDEINACLTSGAPKKVAPKAPPRPAPVKPGDPPAKPASAPAADIPDELLTLDVPNVRIHEGSFQVGVPASLNLITFSVPVILQAQGVFVKGDDMWVFRPNSVYLGSMPLHRLPGLTALMIKRIAHSNAVPDEAVAAWKRVSDVSLGGRLLHLTVGNTAAAEAAPETVAPPTTTTPAAAPAPTATSSTPASATATPAPTTVAPAATEPAK